MTSIVRQEVFQSAETVIVKIGSNVLAREDQRLDEERVRHLSDQIQRILQTGRRVIIVSSGAVAAGLGLLNRNQRPTALPELQATAAIGQAELMSAWSRAFTEHQRTVGQILLTASDLQNRGRYLNVRNTIRTLFDMGSVPIVNENDSISVDEIAFSDNDQLAAMLATLVPKPLLVILSSVDGLMQSDESGRFSSPIKVVETPDKQLLELVTSDSSSMGRGGMTAKLNSILNAVSFGENVILANGATHGILDSIRQGELVGTLFVGQGQMIPAWKKWIGVAAKAAGVLQLDEGASQAVKEGGRSLLAVGIRKVIGEFLPGDTVEIQTTAGRKIGRGLVNYSSADVQLIAGHRSEDIQRLLGHIPFAEVVHRDNMLVRD